MSCPYGSPDMVWVACLLGSQLLNESQIRWSSSGSGAETRHSQSLVKTDENCSSCLISVPSSRRQAHVESESLPEVCSPMPDASCGAMSEKSFTNSKVFEKLAQVVAQLRSQLAGKEEDSDTSDVNEPLPVPGQRTPPPSHSKWKKCDRRCER